MYSPLKVGRELGEQVAQNPDPRLRGNAPLTTGLDGKAATERQRRPAKRSCIEKNLRPQDFFITPVGHEVADDRVLDALANARAIAAKVVTWLPTGHRIATAVKEFCIRNCA